MAIAVDVWKLYSRPTVDDAAILSSSLQRISLQPPPGTVRFDVLVSRDSDTKYVVVHVRCAPSSICWSSEVCDVLTADPECIRCTPVFSDWHESLPVSAAALSHSLEETPGKLESCPCFLVHFYIHPSSVSEFIRLLVEEATLVRALEGKNIRFDILRVATEASQFIVYEVLESVEALAEHATAPHYLNVRAALVDMQAAPRSHDKGYAIIAPMSLEKWRTDAGRAHHHSLM
jgi:quinol monooxygenase YgiN